MELHLEGVYAESDDLLFGGTASLQTLLLMVESSRPGDGFAKEAMTRISGAPAF